MDINNLTVIRYTFEPYYNGYFEGGSWYDCEGKKILVRYYNGRCCLQVKGRRFGLNKLRKFAQKKEVKEVKLPF